MFRSKKKVYEIVEITEADGEIYCVVKCDGKYMCYDERSNVVSTDKFHTKYTTKFEDVVSAMKSAGYLKKETVIGSWEV